MLNKNMTTDTYKNPKRDIKVKEPQWPAEGEHTLDSFGTLVVYKEGRWVDLENLARSCSAFYDAE
jgi:hypothetical protein